MAAYNVSVSPEYKRTQAIQEYNAKVDEYRACMKQFIADQDESIGRHVNAADNAEVELEAFEAELLK